MHAVLADISFAFLLANILDNDTPLDKTLPYYLMTVLFPLFLFLFCLISILFSSPDSP